MCPRWIPASRPRIRPRVRAGRDTKTSAGSPCQEDTQWYIICDSVKTANAQVVSNNAGFDRWRTGVIDQRIFKPCRTPNNTNHEMRDRMPRTTSRLSHLVSTYRAGSQSLMRAATSQQGRYRIITPWPSPVRPTGSVDRQGGLFFSPSQHAFGEWPVALLPQDE